jgi:NhaA family Na+:H+ antiporter
VVRPRGAPPHAGVKLTLPIQQAEIAIGALVGLVLGKPLGIMAAALVAVKSGVAKLPRAVSWTSLLGYAWLAGIGFTMSLFIAMLAFDETATVDAAKLGILAGSLLAGVAGAVVLRIASGFRNDE